MIGLSSRIGSPACVNSNRSSVASGASFTGFTTTVTVPTEVSPEGSATVYSNEAVPKKSSAGVTTILPSASIDAKRSALDVTD